MTHWLLEERDHVIKSNQFTSKKQTFIELFIWAEHKPESGHQGEQATALASSSPINVADRHMSKREGS